jgi:hypothetical protein
MQTDTDLMHYSLIMKLTSKYKPIVYALMNCNLIFF